MSSRLYFTKLFYSSADHHGIAKLHGHLIEITEPPLQGLEDIEYTPEVGVHRCKDVQGWRDMKDPEIKAADLFLAEIHSHDNRST